LENTKEVELFVPVPDCPKSKPRTQLFAAISLVTTRL
jgi:hypothetical protein